MTITASRTATGAHYDSESGLRLDQLSRHERESTSTMGQRLGGDSVPATQWDTNEGWPVALAGAATFFVYLGLIYSYGIVQLHLAKRQLASVPTLSFIGSVAAAISPLACTIVARIINRIGYRATAITGAFFLGLGEFTAGFSTKSVPAMFITQGVLFGIGGALTFLVCPTKVALNGC